MITSIKNTIFATLALLGLTLALQVAAPAVTYAQSAEASVCQGTGGTFNTGTGKCTPPAGTAEVFDDDANGDSVFSRITSLLIFIVGAISVLMIIIGGIRYSLSQGDAQATQNAKNTILYSIVGLIIAFAAFGIAEFVFKRVSNPAPVPVPAAEARAEQNG